MAKNGGKRRKKNYEKWSVKTVNVDHKNHFYWYSKTTNFAYDFKYFHFFFFAFLSFLTARPTSCIFEKICYKYSYNKRIFVAKKKRKKNPKKPNEN